MALQITVSDGTTGETQRTFVLKAEPVELCVADKKEDRNTKKEVRAYCLHLLCRAFEVVVMALQGHSSRLSLLGLCTEEAHVMPRPVGPVKR